MTVLTNAERQAIYRRRQREKMAALIEALQPLALIAAAEDRPDRGDDELVTIRVTVGALRRVSDALEGVGRWQSETVR